MRIVIDLQGAQSGSRLRGIGRYSLALALSIVRHRGNHDVVIALNGAFPDSVRALRDEFISHLPRENICVWSAPGPMQADNPANLKRRSRGEVVYEAFVASLEPDMLLVSSLFEGLRDDAVSSVHAYGFDIPTAVTLYDLIPLHNPERFLEPYPVVEPLYREQVSTLSRADLLLAISDFTAQDASVRLENPDQRIVNISTACDDIFKPTVMSEQDRMKLRERLSLQQPYILTSGTIEPHKNTITLMQAFANLPNDLRKKHKLALIGDADTYQRGVLKEMAEQAGLKVNEFILTGYVTDDELVAVYSDAELMVFPSTDEGFGLPPLEAMSCGTPTLAARAASLPEVINMEEAMFDPFDSDGLSALMARALEDHEFRAVLTANAQSRAKSFSWDETGKRALAAMEQLVGATPVRKTSGKSTVFDRCLEHISMNMPTPQELPALAQMLACNFPDTSRPRQLFVDITEVHHHDARTGIQRVTRSILMEWLKTPPKGISVEPVYATDDCMGYRYAHAFKSRLMETEPDGADDIIDYRQGDIFFGLDLQNHVVVYQEPWLRDMWLRGVEVRFLVYDLLPIQFPQFFVEGTDKGFQTWLRTISGFDGVIGISQDAADAFRDWRESHDIVENANFHYDFAHLGADIENSLPSTGLPESSKSVLHAISDSPTFLMVGTVEPRKGHEQVLSAFELLWKQGQKINLVIVGKHGWISKEFAKKLKNHPQKDVRLFWLVGISDEYLQEVYGSANCLLAASEAEGFGLPLIEAAQAHIPILARDIAVFREVAGDHATYFTAKTPEELAESISDWLDKDGSGQTISSENMNWLTWAESAARMAKILVNDDADTEKVLV